MIGRALRAEIDRYAAEMKGNNPLFTKAVDGSLTPAILARYLTNIHHMLSLTPVMLARAELRARAVGDEALAKHYVHKNAEEVGHDAWAERDLARITQDAKARTPRAVVPAIRGLVRWLEETIDRDPTLYLSYILFTEQLIVVLGPEWLELLERNCGIPHTSMTAIGNHVELDKHHVEEALEEIDDLVGDPTKLSEMRDALHAAMSYFDRFCIEVTTTEISHDDTRHAAPAVSAA